MRYLIIIFILSSCAVSPIFNERRANRKINKARRLAPSLFMNEKDSVITPTINIDTTSQLIGNDTITIINKEKEILKYYYNTKTNDIHHDLKIKSDTIYFEREVIREVKSDKWYDRWEFPALIIVVLLVLVFNNRK